MKMNVYIASTDTPVALQQDLMMKDFEGELKKDNSWIDIFYFIFPVWMKTSYFTQAYNGAKKPHVIIVSAGSDFIDALVDFAQFLHKYGILLIICSKQKFPRSSLELDEMTEGHNLIMLEYKDDLSEVWGHIFARLNSQHIMLQLHKAI